MPAGQGSGSGLECRRCLACGRPCRRAGGRSLLIIDDHPTRRSVLERYAASWGTRPESAGNGEQAVLRLRSRASEGEAFQLAIIDMQMSKTDDMQMSEGAAAALAREISADHTLGVTQLVHRTDSSL
jgi:CheY-like chemotaxis protein